MGTSEPEDAIDQLREADAETTKAPRMQGFRAMGAAGFEPATSRV
jgi:hypothetical protein